jgi:hypothetical protein
MDAFKVRSLTFKKEGVAMQTAQKLAQKQDVMRLSCADKAELEELMDEHTDQGWKFGKVRFYQGRFMVIGTKPKES